MSLQVAGQLGLAEQLYQQVLRDAPDHAVANHCLGMLNLQLRRPAQGLPFLLTALLAHPDILDYWLGYLEALVQADQIAAAQEALALARQHGASGRALEEFAARLQVRVPQPVRPFIVAAPAYEHRSAGIRVLHTLCNELNLCGYTAHLLFYRMKPGGVLEFYSPDGDGAYCAQHTAIPRLPPSADVGRFRTLIDEAYVIYPEVLQGNPLQAARVVRYVLNTPAANGYPMMEGAGDFIVGFSRQFWQSPHAHAPLVVEDPIFHDRETRPAMARTLDCTYIGKGESFGPCSKIPGTVQIERHWPADKESLAILLRNTRYFFTWDLNTQTNIDALMCGAILVVPRWAPFSPAWLESDFGPVPYAESTIENGILKIAHNTDDYELKRRRFIESFIATAQRRTQTVRRLAEDIALYFDSLKAGE